METDLADPETIALIEKVLADFGNEQGPMDEDEAMFCARFGDFERKTRGGNSFEKGSGRVRQSGMKRVSEVYTMERFAREKVAEKERLEKELRQN